MFKSAAVPYPASENYFADNKFGNFLTMIFDFWRLPFPNDR